MIPANFCENDGEKFLEPEWNFCPKCGCERGYIQEEISDKEPFLSQEEIDVIFQVIETPFAREIDFDRFICQFDMSISTGWTWSSD